MALENVLATIRREAEEHATRVRGDAREEAAAIEERARERAARWRKEMETAAAREGEEIRGTVVHQARLDALRRTRVAREAVFQEAWSRVRERLAAARNDAGYPGLFAALLAEAESALPDATVVRVDPRDAALAPEAETTLESWGGVELATRDGRVVRNTLEERLRRAEPELRRLAARELGLA